MYKIDFKPNVKKDFKNINKSDVAFIRSSLYDFVENFNADYEIALMNTGKIKKLQGQKEILYHLKLRSYRVIYKKEDDRLVILVVHVTTREGAYK
ncbi:MAG: type II toxin-antitoxin system mRNA interferase toxin, RelE/StbE family [Sulfurimonas sp.]|nr:type II toxin-antitoxin system mRNA interferase toxin, RelE/StbE family [Sulfurimonas sp.]MBU1216947.1 type II toxin-antitoxin system mRNA interferase toxin, RelE/StbE family [bacterium]MBU1435074.1 type II toxin-antitoxin system mRNA interferase toxin, RelE/StbE family [bacterium]MBU1504179.1 type II toxin-antitoxin system mRNA interferase toxin, RelE/StbE family [bacterium]MBU3938169.1 type II toxin-antitoxin system mRNA interferase toxin, RelE/StbE family [bacterium]